MKGVNENMCTSSTASSEQEGDGENSAPINLNHSMLKSAISSGMPTFLHTTGVPIIDRRNKKLVTSDALAQTQRDTLPPGDSVYPPAAPLCLRGHTPATGGTGATTRQNIPTRVRVRPQRSVRGPRGVRDIPVGKFLRPGVLGGLSVSPWVVQEEAERVRRMGSHRLALSKDAFVFRRKRDEGSLLDYAEETNGVKRFLEQTHPIRDESCPPKCGFSYRRVGHEIEPPDFYDTSLDSVRPRTVGYSPGHVRSLSPTPALMWGGRASARENLQWRKGTGGSLGAVEASLGGTEMCRSRRIRPRSVPIAELGGYRSWAVESFGSEQYPGIKQGNHNDAHSDEDPGREDELEIRPMWSHQGPRSALSLSSPYPALRPFSSSYDHLGRTMTREVLSRATTNLRPQQFDTLQRRSEYCDALNVKRGARQLRLATEAKSVMLEKERAKNAAEEREGIKGFEGSLKAVLTKKWKYL